MAKYLDEIGLAHFWNNIKDRIGGASQAQVNEWLDNHPEATTTVQDGAISTDKLANGAVTTGKLADESVTLQKLDPTLGEFFDGLNNLLSALSSGVSMTYTTANKFFNIEALRAALRGVSKPGNNETAYAQVSAQFDVSSEGDTSTATLLQTATSSTASSNMQATASGSPSASVELGSGNGTSTIDMAAAAGLKLNSSGRIKGFNFGFSTGATNSNGVTTFNPGLGVKPTAVFVTAGKASNETEAVAKIAVPMVWSIDSATQVQVRWQRSDTNEWIARNAVGWYWLAIY